MATAFLFPLTRLFAAVEALVYWFSPRPAPAAAARAEAVPPRAAPAHRATPLRVVRIVEPSAPGAAAGRMVISGRLADVCAELDRLVAQEAQNEAGTLPRAVGWH